MMSGMFNGRIGKMAGGIFGSKAIDASKSGGQLSPTATGAATQVLDRRVKSARAGTAQASGLASQTLLG